MLTTLAIDDDILAAARRLAVRNRKTVGEVISALARQGLAQATCAPGVERNGVPLLSSRRNATSVAPELIARLRDELP